MRTTSIILSGHVRVGMEDNPCLQPGVYAKTNAQLVEKIVKISEALVRGIASPAESKAIIDRNR